MRPDPLPSLALVVAISLFWGCAKREDVPTLQGIAEKQNTEIAPKASVDSKSNSSSTVGTAAAGNSPVRVRSYPAYLTAYDVMTQEDEFYFYYLNNMCLGADIGQWSLVKSIVGLGQNIVDANLLATLANQTIHISDQPRAAPIIKIVQECAQILGIEAPAVHIEGNHETNAFVAGLREPHILILTSGLLELYQETPDELRFIIGHELGHIKAQHIKTHFLGSTFVSALIGERGKRATFKEDFIASLSIGTLLHWYRESEISADRAGLICVGGDLNVAKQALLRLIHQTKPSNQLFDPSHPDFDAGLVLQHQMQLRSEPFVKIISHLRQSKLSHPFIPERCAALEMWSLSAEYLSMLERRTKPSPERSLVITSIKVLNIPKVDTYVPFVDSGASDPIVKVTYAQTSRETPHQVDQIDATWPNLELEYTVSEGANLIVELFDYNATLSPSFIGSCLVPIKSSAASSEKARADFRLDVLQTSTVVDRPSVAIEYRIENNRQKK